MSDGFQFLDIIFFAMVAAFLILRLRSVLGRRTGHQPRRDNKLPGAKQAADSDGKVIELSDRSKPTDDQDAEAGDPSGNGIADSPADGSVAAGLTQIQIADDGFDPDEFLSGARSAFEMVVHAFATGDTGALRSLLSDEVFENFQAAITERLKAGETLETTVIAIKTADLIEAEMAGRTAMISIKFVTEQVNVTRDTEGHVVDGDPNQMTDVTDIWTFARNTRGRDPNWKLVETRSPN